MTYETSTLYMYYGNSGASDASNGDNTFVFFDGFDGATLNTTTNWNVFQGDTPTVSGGLLDLASAGSVSGIDSQTSFSSPIALHTRSYWSESSVTSTHYHALRSYGSWSYRVCDMYSTAQNNQCAIYSHDGGAGEGDSFIAISDPTIYCKWVTKWYAEDNAYAYQDGTQLANHTSEVPNNTHNMGIVFREGSASGDHVYVDWVFIRKCSDPEPTSTVGEEVTLPVELSAFTATYVNEFVTISWQTASETDVIGFNIYRSEEDAFSTTSDPINKDIIEGHGTTTTMNDYWFTDATADPYYTTYYYWLEVVNLGGSSDVYGSIIYEPGDIDNNEEINIIYSHLNNCYPNPAASGNTIKFGFRLGGLELTNRHVELKVYNVLGELVEEIVNEERLVKYYPEQWTPKNLPSGIYFYQLKTENYNETKKMLLLR